MANSPQLGPSKSSSGITKSSSGTVKRHAACDECRTRKLKCSGSHPKCGRCEKEGLRCEYSLQKQMGRPKKRRREDGATLSPPGVDRPLNLHSPASTPMRQSTATNELALVDELGFGNFMAYTPPLAPQGQPRTDVHTDAILHTATSQSSDLYGNGSMSHAWHDTTTAMNSSAMFITTSIYPNSSISGDYSLTSLPTPQSIPSPIFSNSYNTSQRMMDSMYSSTLSCACLSTMYLTLSSLSTIQNFDFPHILSPLRSALGVASSVMDCPQCPLDSSSAVQNLGVLNTLLFSIVERFCQGLRAIDLEAGQLVETGATKTFRMGDSNPDSAYLHDGTPDCPAAWNVELQAADWKRLAKKAIQAEAGMTAGRPKDKTLTGLIDRLIARQLRWHSDPEMLARRPWCQSVGAQHGGALASPPYATHTEHDHNGCEYNCIRQAKTLREMMDQMQFE